MNTYLFKYIYLTIFLILTSCSGGGAGNPVSRTTTVDDGHVVTDTITPIISDVSISSNNATPTNAIQGNTISLTFNFDEAVVTPVVTIAGGNASVSGSGSGPYTAALLMDLTHTTGAVVFNISFADTVGNAGSTQVTTDASSVTYNPVLSLIVTKTISSISVAGQSQFSAEAVFADFTRSFVTTSATWSSANTGIATINGTGLATGVGGGTTNITASYLGLTSNDALTVLSATLTSVQIDNINPTISSAGSIQLLATGNYSDGSSVNITTLATWTSSNTGVATVNDGASKGLATAVTPGTTTITINYGGQSNTTTLTVDAKTLTSIDIDPFVGSSGLGDTKQFYATGRYSDGSTQDITTITTWSSTDSSIISIDDSVNKGKASMISAGTSSILANLGSISNTVSHTVLSKTLSSITVTPGTTNLPNGISTQAVAIGTYSDASTETITDSVVWSTSDSNVFNVSNDSGKKGWVSSSGVGSTMLVATSGAVSSSATVSVTSATLTSLTMSPGSAFLTAGGETSLSLIGKFSDNQDIDLTKIASWSSNDITRGVVSNSFANRGKVTNVYSGGGTVDFVVSATAGGQTANANIIITPATVTGIILNYNAVTLNAFSTLQVRAYATYSDGASTDVTNLATWASSDNSFSYVSNALLSKGLVTAIANGSANISATYGGQTSANLVVTVSAAAESTPEVGVGLTGSFYTGMSYDTLKGVRVDSSINFNWGAGNAPLGVGNSFSINWEGRTKAPATEVCTFRTWSDDGVRLWVDGEVIIENWTNHGATNDYGAVSLTAGQFYDVRLNFYENGGAARIRLYWNCPSLGGTDQIIAQQYLYPTMNPVTSIVNPTNLSNLKVWLDATDFHGNGTPNNDGDAFATDWVDKSGNTNDYNIVAGPVFRTGTSALNNLAAVEITSGGFDGPAGAALPATGRWTICFVAKKLATDIDGRLFDGSASNYILGYWGNYRGSVYLNGTPSCHNGCQATTTGVTTRHLQCYVRRTAGHLEYWNDGVYMGAGYRATNNASGVIFDINQGANSGESSHSQIGEYIMYDTDLKQHQLNSLQNYLKNKWGI